MTTIKFPRQEKEATYEERVIDYRTKARAECLAKDINNIDKLHCFKEIDTDIMMANVAQISELIEVVRKAND